jgi:hypothetical protein
MARYTDAPVYVHVDSVRIIMDLALFPSGAYMRKDIKEKYQYVDYCTRCACPKKKAEKYLCGANRNFIGANIKHSWKRKL